MASIDISIIIPSKNNGGKTAEIIKKTAKEINNLSVEFIVIDMNSSDNGILETLNVIKKNDLRGFVIQSGTGPVSAALNTGIYKANGKYLSFVYPTRLYENYLGEYYQAAIQKDSDFVFASSQKESEPFLYDNPIVSAVDAAIEIMNSRLKIDFAAVLIKREFLLNHTVKFNEDCTFGYAEAFILNLLIYDPKISCVDLVLKKDEIHSVKKEEQVQTVKNCFDRLEAMIRVYHDAERKQKEHTALLEILKYEKLPAIVLSCIHILLRNGFGASSVKKLLKAKHYDIYLTTSKKTPKRLRLKILLWKTAPAIYVKRYH